MSALSDRARDFWDRISPRERRLVVIAAIATPIVLAIWLGLAIHDGLARMDARNERTRKAIRYVEELHSKGAVTQPSAGDDVKLTATSLPLQSYLDTAARKAGFVLKGTTPHSDQARNGFVTSSVSCSLDKLTIEQLKSFLQEVETSKVVAVTHLDVRKDFRDKDKLDVTLEVSTYSLEPPKTDAQGSAGSGKANP